MNVITMAEYKYLARATKLNANGSTIHQINNLLGELSFVAEFGPKYKDTDPDKYNFCLAVQKKALVALSTL